MSNINVVQSCWNFAQLSKIKNKHVAKIWGLYLKKQRFGDTMWFPEGLENTPWNFDYTKGWSPKFATGLNVIIGIDQEIYEWPDCSFTKMVYSKGSFFVLCLLWYLSQS